MTHTSRFLSIAVVLALAFSLGLGQPGFVTILHVNDTHSNLAPIGPRTDDLEGTLGGLARVATIVQNERAHAKDLLFLHAGDYSIGDPFYTKYFGVPELQMLRLLGLDAMAVGNHEFDLTPATLLQSLQTAFPRRGFPLLSANTNLEHPDVQALKEYVQPYVIKRMGRIKIGIFGMTTPATNILSQPAPASIEGETAEELLGIAGATVGALKAEGCDIIICLSHLGFGIDQAVAAYVPGINVIVGGHDHFTFEKPVEIVGVSGEPTWIVQAGSFYRNVGKMRLKIHRGTVKMLSYELIPVKKSIREAPMVALAVKSLIRGIENTYGPLYTQQVAYVTSYFEEVANDLFDAGYKDTPIGNLVTDAYRARYGTDVAIQAGGSTAHPLYPGPIVAADVFRVNGYGFNTINGLGYQMATFKMYGAALIAGLEFGLADIESNYDEFFIQVSGLKYTYNPLAPSESRVGAISLDDGTFDPTALYTVTANELVPLFLDQVGIPFEDLEIHEGETEFETLLGYVQGKALVPSVEGRIECAPIAPTPGLAELDGSKTRDSNVPEEFRLEQNYPNPFNPSTTIPYAVATQAYVRLSIFNMLGQEVAQLVSADQAPGTYTAVWDASGNASGLYIVRLEAGPVAATRKIHLIK
jgi:5'-nucleotidase/UDP-sugar diphosphatase